MPKTGLPRSHCGVVGPTRQWEQKSGTHPKQGGPPHSDSFEEGDLKTAFDGAQTLWSPLMRMLQRPRKFELACLVLKLSSGIVLVDPVRRASSAAFMIDADERRSNTWEGDFRYYFAGFGRESQNGNQKSIVGALPVCCPVGIL